ncbi:ketopantoate reductase [[Leptolyngbya] sp. PCC 7376]|uniref:putative 2-dehydropantoate 2-reductase n=1 Tax=[Leptolyngbya] sp. PCC 7376 TaxID=111781 RepID=UPI00029ED5CD|nr:putative 2-dehydropantoate 2-reductase [[Leptolyngbya] sp. PCC 7376]AFY39303.1 ketopantoate reductase [[Leptolyngbya] sp. PCC 7376]
MPNLRYAVIGTGAIGGFYGGKLQHSGQDVHFLLHSDYEYVQQHGLRVDSVDGDFHLPQVWAYKNTKDMPLCDVVIVALKTTQNHLLETLLPPILKPNSIILLLQNGLGVEPKLQALFPTQTIIGGLCFICSNKIAPGHIHHLDYGAVLLGQYTENYEPQEIPDSLKQISKDFQQADIAIDLTDDLLFARWKKLVWNIPFNGLSVVLNATTDQLMNIPQSYELAKTLMLEVLQGAKIHGRELPVSLVQEMLDNTAKMKPYRTSMKIDYDEQRPLELEAMFAQPLASGQSNKEKLPCIDTLYKQLCFLNETNLTEQRTNG